MLGLIEAAALSMKRTKNLAAAKARDRLAQVFRENPP
jgi:hypothetical protein